MHHLTQGYKQAFGGVYKVEKLETISGEDITDSRMAKFSDYLSFAPSRSAKVSGELVLSELLDSVKKISVYGPKSFGEDAKINNPSNDPYFVIFTDNDVEPDEAQGFLPTAEAYINAAGNRFTHILKMKVAASGFVPLGFAPKGFEIIG